MQKMAKMHVQFKIACAFFVYSTSKVIPKKPKIQKKAKRIFQFPKICMQTNGRIEYFKKACKKAPL